MIKNIEDGKEFVKNYLLNECLFSWPEIPDSWFCCFQNMADERLWYIEIYQNQDGKVIKIGSSMYYVGYNLKTSCLKFYQEIKEGKEHLEIKKMPLPPGERD